MTAETSPLRRFGAMTVAVLLLIWFLLQVIYFQRAYGDLWTVFPALVGFWHFSWDNSPPLEIIQTCVANSLFLIIGFLFLRIVGGGGGSIAGLANAWTAGLSIAGISLVLLTMCRGLYMIPAWLALLLPAAALALAGSQSRLRDWFAEPLGEWTEADDPADERIIFAPSADGLLATLLWVMISLITIGTFWNALFYPETYWDSLILYLGYARMTFFEHGFPFKAEGQVGIGLGANYPHLYSTLGAGISMLFNHWSDLHQRAIAPVAGLVATVFVYLAVYRLWRSVLMAACVALLFRSIPNGIAYLTFASDYALAIVLCAQFVHAAVEFSLKPSRGTLVMLLLAPVAGMHLNFLMGLLWIPAGCQILAVLLLNRRFQSIATLRPVVAIGMLMVLLASPWYIRNWVLTGNPVYAFFPKIFTASVRINPEVMESATLEWFRVGDGVGQSAEIYHDWRTGQDRDLADPDYRRQATLRDRLAASHFFWFGYDVIRFADDGRPTTGHLLANVAHLTPRLTAEPRETQRLDEGRVLFRNPHSYKMSPLFPGLVIPGVLLCLAFPFTATGRSMGVARLIAIYTSLMLLAGFVSYNYLLADFYLYQIIGFVAPAMVAVAVVLSWVMLRSRILSAAVIILVLIQAVVPGMAFSIRNFKVFGSVEIDGTTYSAAALDHFRQPGMPAEWIYRMRFPDDVPMWNHVNEHLAGERLLTHENRHYVYDPTITIVHLDDWAMQQLYDMEDPAALAKALRNHDLEYYLYIENEDRHFVNARLGMKKLLEAGHLEELYASGKNRLYRILSEPRNGS